MLIFSILFPDLIKFPYFMNTLKEEFGGEKRPSDSINNFNIYTYTGFTLRIYDYWHLDAQH